jgi:hypothetical protein
LDINCRFKREEANCPEQGNPGERAMTPPPHAYPLIIAATLAAGLGGCATYDDYGYGQASIGYATPYYYESYGSPYYGWHDGYYYPGTGYYVYDRGGNRHHWDDSHRRYWESHGRSRAGHENWSGYHGNHSNNRQGDRHSGNWSEIPRTHSNGEHRGYGRGGRTDHAQHDNRNNRDN